MSSSFMTSRLSLMGSNSSWHCVVTRSRGSMRNSTFSISPPIFLRSFTSSFSCSVYSVFRSMMASMLRPMRSLSVLKSSSARFFSLGFLLRTSPRPWARFLAASSRCALRSFSLPGFVRIFFVSGRMSSVERVGLLLIGIRIGLRREGVPREGLREFMLPCVGLRLKVPTVGERASLPTVGLRLAPEYRGRLQCFGVTESIFEIHFGRELPLAMESSDALISAGPSSVCA
mmetsp:Transcript_44247/g.138910  ORF Transcript_44247/g.138910 Transcript_44247/m.138910 type:complete len:230 (-) Transcript_44247:761-1450(-)